MEQTSSTDPLRSSELAGPALTTNLGWSLGSSMETHGSSVSTYQGITVQLSYL